MALQQQENNRLSFLRAMFMMGFGVCPNCDCGCNSSRKMKLKCWAEKMLQAFSSRTRAAVYPIFALIVQQEWSVVFERELFTETKSAI